QIKGGAPALTVDARSDCWSGLGAPILAASWNGPSWSSTHRSTSRSSSIEANEVRPSAPSVTGRAHPRSPAGYERNADVRMRPCDLDSGDPEVGRPCAEHDNDHAHRRGRSVTCGCG